MAKELWKGNEALAEAAVRAGCQAFFGYPITPQTELVGRIARTAIRLARQQGLKLGLFRPVSLWPYPAAALADTAQGVKALLVVEMNAGQMLQDVRLACGQSLPIHFLGRMGGVVPLQEEIVYEAQQLTQVVHSLETL
jgi:pyruvate/2-oxoacid:ferredoxin oxidoreductase alpha subunit